MCEHQQVLLHRHAFGARHLSETAGSAATGSRNIGQRLEVLLGQGGLGRGAAFVALKNQFCRGGHPALIIKGHLRARRSSRQRAGAAFRVRKPDGVWQNLCG